MDYIEHNELGIETNYYDLSYQIQLGTNLSCGQVELIGLEVQSKDYEIECLKNKI